MFAKIKIYILLTLALLAFPRAVMAGEEEGSGALSAFSGNDNLRREIWRLAAFMPPGLRGDGGQRTLVLNDISGLPPVTITMDFDEFLDPWPSRLEAVFVAEESDPPVFFTISDQRPFGGPNLQLKGQAPHDNTQPSKLGTTPARTFEDLLSRLNQRLLAAKPLLGPIKWQDNGPGFQVTRTKLLYGARLGSADLFLARFDPAIYTFHPYHESEFPGASQVAVSGWADRLKSAVALINGGQYYPNRTYMGLLAREGQSLSPAPHPKWKGFLAAGPTPEAPVGLPQATLIDLYENGESEIKPEYYRNVMQSFMVLDRQGIIRVRDSRNLAGRAAIGLDKSGHIILIMTPAATTLYDLAQALKDPRLELVKVMGLDGGFETQLLVRQDNDTFQSGGHFSVTETRAVFLPGLFRTLPTVIAVEMLPQP